MFPMEDKASKVCALEILGTQSMPKAVSLFLAKASTRSLFWAGYKNEYRIPSSLKWAVSLIDGARIFKTKSDLKAAALSTILAPEAS